MAVLSDIFRGLVAVPAAARTSVRHAFELSDRGATQSDSHRTLLYGAGWAGVIVARSAQRTPGASITPVGFLDDHPCLKGSRAEGLPIFGDESAMAAARRRTHASSLLITMPHAPGEQIRRVVDAAAKLGLPVRTVPGIAELPDRTVDVSGARPVTLDDLLRGPATAPSSGLLALVEGHTIMVTGAGGRIGSEIARRLVGLKPARIVMVDRSEHDLSAIADELQCVHQVRQGSTLVTKHLVDITDRAAISVLIGRTKPVAILHAATLREGSTPAASVAHVTRGNISGTRSLVEAAADRRVERFVLVSTDDAREPSNATGASMRVAEMIVADAARKTGDHFTSVRVGRLVGRSEAAIEALRSQLESGELVTVNASEPKCYLMNIAEASELVLEAAALAEPGHVYRLDQGTPLRVGDVARDLIRLLGADPDLVPIRIVGRPPSDEPGHRGAVISTAVPRLLGSAAVTTPPVTLQVDVERFLELARAGRSDQLRADLARYVRFIDSKDTPYLDEHGLRPMVPVPVTTSASEPSRGLFDGRRSGTLAGKVAILPVSAVPAASETSSAAVERVRSRGSQPK